jgi:hypothetical protein
MAPLSQKVGAGRASNKSVDYCRRQLLANAAIAASRVRVTAKQMQGVATMARPTGERRPRDEGKDPAAVALGRRGGHARAQGLSKKRRKEIAKKAAQARWRK